MKKLLAVVVALAAAYVSSAPGTVSAQRGGRRAAIAARVATLVARDGSARVIVRLRTSFTPEGALEGAHRQAQRRAIADTGDAVVRDTERAARRLRRLRRFASVPLLAAEVDAATLDALAAHPGVAEIVEDTPQLPTLAESGPLVGAPAAAARGFTGSGWAVAILDTGVDSTHPFLAGKVIAEGCYSTTDSSATSLCPGGADGMGAGMGEPCAIAGCEHGTHVAGIAAGRGAGFSGIASSASIISMNVFSRFDRNAGCVTYPCIASYTSDEIAALEQVYAMRGTYRIAAVNMSLGGGGTTSACDTNPMKPIVDQLRSVGIATVISSGNNGFTNALSSPACISSAISVGSIDDGSFFTTAYAVSGYSNSAPFLTLLAPGRWITSSVPGGGYATYAGTSMAAPHVAGAWAVMRSAMPNATVDQVLAALASAGRAITDPRNGVTTPLIQLDEATRAVAPSITINDAPARPVLLWQNTMTGSVEAWHMDGTSLSGSDTLPPAADSAWNLVGSGDFNGDGQRDLVWQHLTQGSLAVWLMNGTARTAVQALTPDRTADTGWQIVGVADLNGDGWPDLVWQHQTQGYLKAWLMNGVTRTQEVALDPPRVSDTNWKIGAVTDVDGDGHPDLVWQHLTQGWLFVSFMNGTVQTGSEYLEPSRLSDPDWRLAGAVDSDGDGLDDDLLWQHSVTGRLAVWRMAGRQLVSQTTLSPDARSAGWRLPGARYLSAAPATDIDGDGRPDLLVEDTGSGAMEAWLMNGARLRQRAGIDEARTPGVWRVAAFADMNGDGHPDIVWQHIDGWLSFSIMSGGHVVETVTPAPQQEPDSGWLIVAAYDVDGDGHPDLVWQHRTLGLMRVWYMNGATRIGTGTFTRDRSNDPGWRIAGVADVDRDGSPDLIWWHPIDGWLTVWYMRGTTYLSSAYLDPDRVANTDWQPVAVADFNQDGSPDMVWQQRSTGALQMWYFSGTRLYDSVWMVPSSMNPGGLIVGAR